MLIHTVRLVLRDSLQNLSLVDIAIRSSFFGQGKAIKLTLGSNNVHQYPYEWTQVDDEILIQRVINRRMDPVTGKIYHLLYSPPENEEIASRLTQRFDDTEEKVLYRKNSSMLSRGSLMSSENTA